MTNAEIYDGVAKFAEEAYALAGTVDPWVKAFRFGRGYNPIDGEFMLMLNNNFAVNVEFDINDGTMSVADRSGRAYRLKPTVISVDAPDAMEQLVAGILNSCTAYGNMVVRDNSELAKVSDTAGIKSFIDFTTIETGGVINFAVEKVPGDFRSSLFVLSVNPPQRYRHEPVMSVQFDLRIGEISVMINRVLIDSYPFGSNDPFMIVVERARKWLWTVEEVSACLSRNKSTAIGAGDERQREA